MNNRFVAACVMALIAGGVAACSSPPPAAAPPGMLPSGTAQVSINGAGLGTTDAVTCASVGSVTTITTGDDDTGTTSAVDNADALSVQFAEIRNLGGFTGSYWRNLGGDAQVQMTGPMFLITGTAAGFNPDNPSARTTGTFTIKVSC